MLRTTERAWRILGRPTGFEAYPLWIIDRVRFHEPRCPAPWSGRVFTLHQYASGASGLPGVKRADLDRFNVLAMGDAGVRVAQLKDALRRAGYSPSAGDEFDEATRRAVLHFQAERKQVQDGLVDLETFAELQWT
jgi:hypothetical protein